MEFWILLKSLQQPSECSVEEKHSWITVRYSSGASQPSLSLSPHPQLGDGLKDSSLHFLSKFLMPGRIEWPLISKNRCSFWLVWWLLECLAQRACLYFVWPRTLPGLRSLPCSICQNLSDPVVAAAWANDNSWNKR